MKKIILLASLFISIVSYSQSKNFNELKINGLYLVVGAAEITYERTLSQESAVGISVMVPLDEDLRDDLQYYISPYYRFYFGKKYASGFFMEGFGALSSSEEDTFFTDSNEYITDFALGIGLGGKWVTNNGFIGELNFGIGRNLFNNNNSSADTFGKIGISLGYRF